MNARALPISRPDAVTDVILTARNAVSSAVQESGASA
jgi:hypothetical protein